MNGNSFHYLDYGVIIVVIGAMTIIMTIFIASTVPATTSFSPLINGIAKSAGLATESVMLPLGFIMGMSRAFSPISAPNIFASEFIKVPAIELIKRNLLPMFSAIFTILIAAMLIVG